MNRCAIVGAVAEKRNPRKAGHYSLLWQCGMFWLETSVVGGQRKG